LPSSKTIEPDFSSNSDSSSQIEIESSSQTPTTSNASHIISNCMLIQHTFNQESRPINSIAEMEQESSESQEAQNFKLLTGLTEQT